MARTILRDETHLYLRENGQILGGAEFRETRDADMSVTLLFKPGVMAATGLHWHEEKTEYLQVVQGHALITIGDETAVFSSSDGPLIIPPFTVHQFRRADSHPLGQSSLDIDLRIKEWTSPPDRRKEAFFRNMIGLLSDRDTSHGGHLAMVRMVVGLFVVMDALDNHPVFLDGPRFLGERGRALVRKGVTRMVMGLVAGVARVLGMKGWYEEYTPQELMEELEERRTL